MPAAPPTSRRRSRLRTAMLVVGTVALTLLGTVVALNLSSGDKRLEYRLAHRYDVEDPQFARSLGSLFGTQVVGGNRITALQNGREIFPAMLGAIRSARRSITLQTYILWSGEVGKTFCRALSERARAGVQVLLLIDWAGSSKLDKGAIRSMKRAGVKVAMFHPPRWRSITRLNHRNHRKVLVVDGRVAFTGGVGIADRWDGNADAKDHWRDLQVRVEGPVVAQIQGAFMDDWLATRSDVMHGDAFFPPLAEVGSQHANVVASTADTGTEHVRLLYLLAIASARRSIRIGNAYFVPDDLTVRTLLAARKRGVSVTVLVPGQITDLKVVQAASRDVYERLLQGGVRIFEFQPTMYHCKVLIVDDLLVSVGSTNFDSRSFRLNAELNLNVLDRELALEQARVFDADLGRAREIRLADWRHRPWTGRLFSWASGRLAPQL